MYASIKLTLGGLLLFVPLFIIAQNLNQYIQLLPAENGLIFGINKKTTVKSLVSTTEGLYVLTQKDGCYLLSGSSMDQLDTLIIPIDRRDTFNTLLLSEDSVYLWSNQREVLNLEEIAKERIEYVGHYFDKNFTATAIEKDEYGRIFVATAHNGLFVFRKDEFGHYTDVPLRLSTIDRQLPSNKVNCLYRDKDNVLWIGTDAGLSTIRENIVTNLSQPKTEPKLKWWQRLFGVSKVEEGFNQPIDAIVSWGDYILFVNSERLFKADRRSDELTNLYDYSINKHLETPMQNIRDIMVDINSNIWLAGDILISYNLTEDKLSVVSENMPFQGRSFLCIIEDVNTGSIWIGMERGGLYEYYDFDQY